MSDDNSGETARKLTEIAKVGSGTAESLRDAGFDSVADVREADTDELTAVDGIGESRATEIKQNAEALADDAVDADEATVEADGGEAAAEAEADESGDEDAESDADGDDSAGDADEAGEEDESADEQDTSDDGGPPAEDIDMLQVKETVQDVAETLIDDPFDGIIEIEQDEEGWYAVVEVIERSSVPDTQDILGRYEIDLDGSGSVLGYRLTDRYRRGDTSNDE